MAEAKPKRERYGGPRGKAKSLSPRKLAFALLCLSNVPQKEAAKQSGFSEHTAKDLISDPLVQQFMADHPKAVASELARCEAKAMLSVCSRESILERLWTLGNLTPEETNGNITGQVKALDTAAEMLGGKVHLSADLTKDFYGRNDEELEFFAQHGYWPMDAKAAGTA